jgi:hypothetical protein
VGVGLLAVLRLVVVVVVLLLLLLERATERC